MNRNYLVYGIIAVAVVVFGLAGVVYFGRMPQSSASADAVTAAAPAGAGGSVQTSGQAAAQNGLGANLPPGNPENGQVVFLNKGGCGACHTIQGVPGAFGIVGPELTHIATVAEKHRQEAGLSSVREYLIQSILDPNAYIVKDCPTGPCIPGTMPMNMKDMLSPQELSDLVAFLMTLQ